MHVSVLVDLHAVLEPRDARPRAALGHADELDLVAQLVVKVKVRGLADARALRVAVVPLAVLGAELLRRRHHDLRVRLVPAQRLRAHLHLGAETSPLAADAVNLRGYRECLQGFIKRFFPVVWAGGPYYQAR